MPEPHPTDAFRPTSSIFRCVLAGVVAANLPLLILWGFDLTWYGDVPYGATTATLLGSTLGAFAASLHAGVDTRRAVDRMSVAIVVFPPVILVLLIAPALVVEKWLTPNNLELHPAGTVVTAIGALLLAALISVAVSLRTSHPRWTWLTRLGALAGMLVVAIVVARPIVNAVGILAASTVSPLGAFEEDVAWRLQYRLLTPTYGDGCSTLIAVLPLIGLVALRRAGDNRRRLAVAMTGGLVLAASWMLFGFEATFLGDVQYTIARREFGRTTVMHFFDGGREVQRSAWTWSRPFELGCMAISKCVNEPAERKTDNDRDGTWDVWTRRLDWPDAASYQCSLAYAVDTTKDGKPDWHFMSPIDEMKQAEERIAKRK